MGFLAGDLKEITINHPLLTGGSIVLQCKSSEDNTYDLGGPRTTDVMTTGSGTSMRKLNNVPWKVMAVIAWDMITGQELQAVNLMSGSTDEGSYTFSSINGSVYGGKGSPVGDLVGNINDSTFPSTFSGGGVLTKIA